jgi:hypothetical protein
MPRRLSFQLASLLFACGLVASVQAAELGDVKVNSFVGQHLSADIELTSLDDPASQVQVRLASVDVYRGANLDMPAVLANVNLSVMRRDGKQFLHVTSTRPVDADHLHLYLELTDGNRRGVRLATLWFAPDPTPPSPPERVAIPMTVPAAATASARKSAPIRPLPADFVPKTKPAPIPDAPFVKVADAEPAGKPSEPPAQAAAASGSSEPAKKQSTVTDATAKPAAALERAAKPVISLLPPAKPLNPAKAPAAPACRKQPSEAENACVALDGKNAELRAEIGKLEARVNSLLAHENSRQPEVSKPAPQGDVPPVAPKPETPAVQAAAGQAASGKVQPARVTSRLPAKPAASPHKKAAASEPEKPGMPWGWIAGAGLAVFAAVGALQFWRRRRKGPKSTTVHAPLPAEEENQAEPTLG